MRVDSQFFIPIAVSMKEADHLVAISLVYMVSLFIFTSASCPS